MDFLAILPRLETAPTNDNSSAKDIAASVPPHTSEGTASIIVNIVMFITTTAWTGLRFYSRGIKSKTYMIEDLLCLTSLVSISNRSYINYGSAS